MKADNPGVGLGRVGVVLGVVLAAAGAAAPGNGAQRAEPAAILYSTPGNSEDEACGAMWSIDPEGGVPRPLDVGLDMSCDPDWSPNARQIAFSGKRVSGNFRIYVADETGASAVPVSHPPPGSDDFMPAWSPDGTRIAFERRPPSGDRYNLFIVDADGTNERQLTHGRGFDGTPWWSPDGRILFVSDRTHQRRGCKDCSALYVLRLSDGHAGRITWNRFNALMPAWSPDGTHIVWARAPSIDAVLRLYVMNSDTTGSRQLDSVGASPAWSPDGRTIVYSSGSGLVLIGVDGSGRRRLTRTDGGSGPSWRPFSGAS